MPITQREFFVNDNLGPLITAHIASSCDAQTGEGGWGIFLQREDREHRWFNYAENTTVNHLLLIATEHLLKHTPPARPLRLICTSTFLVNGLRRDLEEWAENDWRSRSGGHLAHVHLWSSINDLVASRHIEVAAPSEHRAGVEEALRLAKRARREVGRNAA